MYLVRNSTRRAEQTPISYGMAMHVRHSGLYSFFTFAQEPRGRSARHGKHACAPRTGRVWNLVSRADSRRFSAHAAENY